MKTSFIFLMAIMALPAMAAQSYLVNAHAWYNDQGDIEITSQPGHMRPAVSPPYPPVPQTTLTLNATQLFGLNSAQLLAPSTSLRVLAEHLRSTPVPRIITLTGYTDSTGSTAYNLRLSALRALAILHWLSAAAPRHYYTANGQGEAHPVAPNSTRVGREQNRRVTITLEDLQ